MPFISIQLNSNRPEQLTLFFDSIEATADTPGDIEVLLHIDKGDRQMEELVAREQARRRFSLRMLQTDMVKNYATLWMPLNPLFKLTHPDAYFVINLSDEMLFLTKGWDSFVRQYEGYYPDHIFRLRASQYRFRNYTDFWECGFAPDSIAFYTRRWLEISGDWNPCLGPDSFQQCVSFYLFTSDPFSHRQLYRDIALPKLEFSGEGAGVGLTGEEMWKRACINVRAWFTLMSHPMQQEAKHRAMRMKAFIVSETHGGPAMVEVMEDEGRKLFVLHDRATKAIIERIPYKLSWWRITLTNLLRIPRFTYYNGGVNKGFLATAMASCTLVAAAFMPPGKGGRFLTWADNFVTRKLKKNRPVS